MGQLQSDGDTELKALEPTLFQEGYVRRIYCLYTTFENGVVERRNMNVIEIGRVMPMRSNVPMIYGVMALK